MPEQPGVTESLAQQVRIALETADLSAFGDLLDPDATWGAPDDPSPACQNRRQVLSWYERGKESGVRAQVSEVAVLGDRILVGLRVKGTGATEESGGEAERWQVLTVRAGRVVDIVGFAERSDAVARAGPANVLEELPSGTTWVEPQRPLADGRVELRLPQHSDAEVLHAYASAEDGLLGTWVPLSQGASLESCEALIRDWLAGWDNQRSLQGPALIIAEAGQAGLVGLVGLGNREDNVVELSYGVAPDRRRRGHATRSARLVARWLLDDGLAGEVELRIGKDNAESRRVASAAGFVLAGTVASHDGAAGDTCDDLRFVMRPA